MRTDWDTVTGLFYLLHTRKPMTAKVRKSSKAGTHLMYTANHMRRKRMGSNTETGGIRNSDKGARERLVDE